MNFGSPQLFNLHPSPFFSSSLFIHLFLLVGQQGLHAAGQENQ